MRETSGPDARSGLVKSTGGRNMAGTIEQKLAAQGITLHEPAAPVANYVGFVRSGNLLFVSGQVCFDPEGKLIAKGKLGAGVTVEQGNAAARGCAVNLLAQIKAALGDLGGGPRCAAGRFCQFGAGFSRRAESLERCLR